MRSHVLYPALAVCLFAGSITSIAQTTIHTYLLDVEAANPGLKASRAGIDQAKARIERSAAWDAPMLQATLMDIPTSSIDLFSGSRDRRISLQQRIPFPGKKSFESDIAEADVVRAVSEDREMRLDIRTMAKILFIDAVGLTKLAAVLHEQLLILEDMIAAVESRYAVGRAGQSDILRLRIEREHLLNLIQSTETDLHTSLYRMNELRGQEPTAPFGPLASVQYSNPLIPLDSLMALALLNRPDIARARAMREGSVAAVNLAKRTYWPDVALGAGYRNSLLMGNTWELMIGISIPIVPWASGEVSGRVEETQARIRESEAQITATHLRVRQEVAQSYRSAQLQHDRLRRYSTRIMPDAHQAMQSLRAAYLTDQADFLSFLDSFRMIESLQMESIGTEVSFLSSVAILEQAVGLDLGSLEQEIQ